jgi:phospholipase/carboxylesterase
MTCSSVKPRQCWHWARLRTDGLLYVPEDYKTKQPAPLALTLHGAGCNARSDISHFLNLADEAGLILPAPESRGRIWDVLVGGYGPDVEFIDRTLKQTFDRLPGNARRLAVTGFSEGLLTPLGGAT